MTTASTYAVRSSESEWSVPGYPPIPLGGDSSLGPAEPPRHPPVVCPKYVSAPTPVAPLPPPWPTIRVRTTDRTTGGPLSRSTGLLEFPDGDGSATYLHVAFADSTGLIRLDSVCTRYVTLLCGGSGWTGNAPTYLDPDQWSRAASGVTVTLRVRSTDCDLPPATRAATVAGSWTGHYTAGYDASRMRLCNDTTLTIWVALSMHVGLPEGFAWLPPEHGRYPTYFVRVRGQLTGPGYFGRRGLAKYALVVDSIEFAREPGPKDCS